MQKTNLKCRIDRQCPQPKKHTRANQKTGSHPRRTNLKGEERKKKREI